MGTELSHIDVLISHLVLFQIILSAHVIDISCFLPKYMYIVILVIKWRGQICIVRRLKPKEIVYGTENSQEFWIQRMKVKHKKKNVQNQLNSRPNLFSHFGVSEMLYIIIKYTYFHSLLQMILFDMSPF